MRNERKEHLLRFLETGKRYDGRNLDEYRPVTVEYGISKNAEGSAQATMGDTIVMAGVKMSIEKPYPDTPDSGNLMVGAELSPASSPKFETGPPGEEAVELARVVDRGIREAKAIDTKALCITRAEKVWGVAIDLVTVNADGSLIDASSLAAIAAIKNAKMPVYDGEKVDYKQRTSSPLPIKKTPIAVTIYKLGRHLLVDPTNEEEELCDARLTVTGTDGKICALQKGGDAPITTEEVDLMVTLALKKAKELEKHL